MATTKELVGMFAGETAGRWLSVKQTAWLFSTAVREGSKMDDRFAMHGSFTDDAGSFVSWSAYRAPNGCANLKVSRTTKADVAAHVRGIARDAALREAMNWLHSESCTKERVETFTARIAAIAAEYADVGV